jgi:hypothetical protein
MLCKPEHSRVCHLQMNLWVSAVHTDLTESESHALHHYAEQKPALRLIAVVQIRTQQPSIPAIAPRVYAVHTDMTESDEHAT